MVNAMGSEEIVLPVQEIALRVTQVPREFVVAEDVQSTLRSRPEDEDTVQSVPIIDLSPLLSGNAEDTKRVKAEIGSACEEWGFFQVVNHGVPENLLESALGVVQGFFDLPLEKKQVYAMASGKTQGYGRVMKPKIRPWSDALRHSVRPRPPSDQDARPKTPASYREVMEEYAEELGNLVRRLTTVLSEYLGLESTALQQQLTKETDDYPAMTITVNLYPVCPEPERVLGIYPHSDAGVMTVLYQDHVGGLQVLKEGKWITVKPTKNALVVNVANQLEILSNGRLKSSKHRVVVNSSKSRTSIAAFCGPGNPDIVIGPLAELIDELNPSLYTTMVYSDYCSAYFSRDMEAKPFSLLDGNRTNDMELSDARRCI